MRDDQDRAYENSVTDALEGNEQGDGFYEDWTPEPFPGAQPEHIPGQLALEHNPGGWPCPCGGPNCADEED